MGKVTILRAGPLTTVQDLGRPRHHHAGISRGGALDRHAACVANLLVGNSESDAVLEISLGHFRMCCDDERVLAWCGAEAVAIIDDEKIPPGHPVRLHPGEKLAFASMTRGCRVWLAISGGISVLQIMKSRSTDLRACFGGLDGRALRDGDELPLGQNTCTISFRGRSAHWNAPNEWSQPTSPSPVLRVIAGAQWHDFTAAARAAFLREFYFVTTRADRMGARLSGPELRRIDKRELLSEAVAPGTIQVANDHQPILLLGDCQTIGGYPKIAHVITADLPITAQLKPNDRVRFQLVEMTEAIALFRVRAKQLALFRAGLKLKS